MNFMKGTIVKCLEEMVTTQFGAAQWKKSLEDAGSKAATLFLPFDDIDDAVVLNVITAVCNNLKLSLAQAADAFGMYWVNVYSQKMYPQYYAKHRTAKDFLLNLDALHVTMTKTLKNARPPRFEYAWRDPKTLIMHYKSHRGLIDFAVGLVKGIGKFYQEELEVKKSGADWIQVVFR